MRGGPRRVWNDDSFRAVYLRAATANYCLSMGFGLSGVPCFSVRRFEVWKHREVFEIEGVELRVQMVYRCSDDAVYGVYTSARTSVRVSTEPHSSLPFSTASKRTASASFRPPRWSINNDVSTTIRIGSLRYRSVLHSLSEL